MLVTSAELSEVTAAGEIKADDAVGPSLSLPFSGIPAWDKEGSSAFFDAASGDMPFTVSESEPPETSEDSSGEASFSSVAARSPLPESMALSFSKGSFSSAAAGTASSVEEAAASAGASAFVKFLLFYDHSSRILGCRWESAFGNEDKS